MEQIYDCASIDEAHSKLLGNPMRNFLEESQLSSFHTVFVVLYINLVILGVANETIHCQQIEGLSIDKSLH